MNVVNDVGKRPKTEKIQLCNILFTKKELDILALICNGRSHKFAACLLGVSLKTIDSHVRNIVLKSGCMSIEHLNNVISVAGKHAYLSDIYVSLLYEREFYEFIETYRIGDKQNVMICYGLYDSSSIEKLKNILIKVGCGCVVVNTSNVDDSFKKILVKTASDYEVDESKFDFVINPDEDGFYLSALKCLRYLKEDDTLEVQINKYIAIVQENNNNSGEQRVNFNWREKMNKYIGVAASACCSVALAGYLYGIYPGMKEVITNQELFLINSDFCKRLDLADAINKALSRKENINIVTLVGPGGAGKTTLARMMMRRYSDNCEVAYELNVETYGALSASLENLCRRLAEDNKVLIERVRGIITDTKESRKFENMVLFVKQQLQKKKRWLLVFDNLENPKVIYPILPSGEKYNKGKVIITTRDQTIFNGVKLGNNQIIEVGELNNTEKYELFNKVASKVGNGKIYAKSDIDLLLAKVPNYPLDVASVACCIAGSNMTSQEYIKKMELESSNFSQPVDKNLMYDLTPYGKTRYGIIVTTLDKILKDIEKDSKMKGALLIMSMCDSQNIPAKLFERYGSEVGFKDRLFALLQKYSFITKGKNSISIHRVIQDMWFKLLAKKLSQREIENALKLFIDKSVCFEEVMHFEHRSNLVQSDRAYYAKLAPSLWKFYKLVDQLDISDKVKYRSKAMSLFCYTVWSQKLFSNIKQNCENFKLALSIGQQYNVLSDLEVAMFKYEYCRAMRHFDLNNATKLIKEAIVVADKTPRADPFRIMCRVIRSNLYSLGGDYLNALVETNNALAEAVTVLNKYPVDYWPKKMYVQTKYYQLNMMLDSKLNNVYFAKSYISAVNELLKMLGAVDVQKEPLAQDKVAGLVPIVKRCMLDVCNRAEEYSQSVKVFEDAKYIYENYPFTSMGIYLSSESLYCDTLLRINKVNDAYKLAVKNCEKMVAVDASKGDILISKANLSEACVRLGRYGEAVKVVDGVNLASGKNSILEAYSRCMFNGLVAAVKLDDKKHAQVFRDNLFAVLKKLAMNLLRSDDAKEKIEGEFDVSNCSLGSCVTKAQHIFKMIYGDHGFVRTYVSKI